LQLFSTFFDAKLQLFSTISTLFLQLFSNSSKISLFILFLIYNFAQIQAA